MTRDRTASSTLSGRTFPIIIAADDKHDWRLAKPSDAPEFERLWAQMEDGSNNFKSKGETMQTQMYRQGDVFLIRSDAVPESATPVKPEADGAIVLAHGEVTGHRHAFYSGGVKMFRDDGAGSGRTFISVTGDAPAELQHEEHSTIPLPAGDYEVRIQSEYHPSAIRSVED